MRWGLAGLALLGWTVASAPVHAAPALHFLRPVALPGGAAHTEPSVVIDSQGRIYVSAIFGVPGAVGPAGTCPNGPGTPVWRSEDGGRTFSCHFTASAGPAATNLSGGDSALVLDKRDYLYGTDLWLGDDSSWYSTDHGNTYFGSPASHRPVDDRNWLAYSRPGDAIYQIYDGFDGLWVSRADLSGPLGIRSSLAFNFNNQIAPEDAAGQGSDSPYVRDDAAPPGGIAVDQRSGTVYASWSDQHGIAVARSTDKGSTWTIGHIPGSQVTGSDTDDLWNFAPIATDSAGDVYVAWGQITQGSANAPVGIGLWLAASRDGGRHWSKYRMPARATAVFPTLAVFGPGHVAVAWVDTAVTGNPNASGFTGATWRLQYAELSGVGRGPIRIMQATVDPAVHTGTLFVGPQGGDRGMGDFFSMAVGPDGRLVVAYTRGQQSANAAMVAVLPHHPAP